MIIPLVFLTVGCIVNPRRARIVVEGKSGTWELTGVDRAELKMDGWSLYIYDTEVVDINTPIYLEKFNLMIVNKDETRPLYIEPGEIWLSGVNHTNLQLGPEKTEVLQADEAWRFFFDEGARAPLLPYPFTMTVTVFRDAKFKKPQTIVFRLY